VDLHRNQFCRKKVALQLKKEDHCKLKKKGLGLVLNFQLGDGKVKPKPRSVFEEITLVVDCLNHTLTDVLKMSIKAMQRFGKHKVMYYTMCTQRKL